MKKLIFILFLLLTLGGFAQKSHCSDFKIGAFKYSDPKMADYFISRTETNQIEKNSKTGIEIHTSIEWKSNCEYILTYEKILNSDQDLSHIIGEKIHIKILETDGKKYSAHVKSNVIDTNLKFVRID